MEKKSGNGLLFKINLLISLYNVMKMNHIKKYLCICAFTFFCVSMSPVFSHSESTESRKLEKYKIRVLEKIELPKHYHEGLYLKGQNIWVSNGQGGETWVIDYENKKIVEKIESVGTFTEGITISDIPDEYWVTDWEDRKIYKVKIQNSKMIKISEISTDSELPAGVINIHGKIYVITWLRTPTGTKYYLLEFDNYGKLTSKRQLEDIYEPAHMAWDEQYLWITSWYSKKVYKVNLESLEVIGRFSSPAKDATGIAYDGKYFWITGTYDDLYKIEIIKGE